ncbi:MAG TPA: oligosaccharide flippase family protein [Solirubrobacteraceae bacterium]|nr:oligosaccharide flippase family protein [Solirubrobacteraceae bacterium]
MAVEQPDLLDTPAAGPAAIRGATLRVGSYVLGALLSVVSGALLFRHLGLIGAGRYTIVLSMIALVSGLADGGLTSIGMRELSVQRGTERRVLASDLLGLRMVISALGVAGMFIFAVVADYPGVVVTGVLIGGAGLMLQSCQSTLSVALMSRLRLGWVSAIGLVSQATTVVLIAVLVLAGAHLLAFIAVSIPAAALALAITAVKVRGDVPLMPTVHRERWRRLVRMVLPYSVAVAAAAIYLQMSVVLVSLIANERQLGLFSASFRVLLALIAIPGLLVGSAFPIFARAARDDAARLAYAVDRVFQISLILGVWMALGVAIGAPLAIQIITGGGTFKAASGVLAIQGLALGALFVGTVWGNVLLSLQRLRAIMYFNIAAVALGAVLVAVLVSLDGARGGAIATAATEAIAALVGGIIVVRGDPRLMPSLATVPRVALAGALGAAPALLTAPVIVKVILSSAIYAAALVLLRVVPEELRQEVRRLRSAG